MYLHGPRFIVPISLFNFRNTNSSTYTPAGISGNTQKKISKTAASTPPAPRSSWPNSRYLIPPQNGLIAKKYRFKSEPRLEVEHLAARAPPKSSIALEKPSGKSQSGNEQSSVAMMSPPTIIQWGDDYGDEMILSGVSSAGSSNASCNNIAGKLSGSRKGSGVSATGSKRSSIFAAFKNPWSYITGIIKQPGNTSDSSTTARYSGSRRDTSVAGNYYEHFGGGGPNDNYLLKPISYYGGQSSSGSQRQKFSSVPDLWAVRGSPDFDVNPHKKHSINSDTGTVGVSVINPASSREIELDNPDPVLKLIVTSHESVYL